MPDLSDRDIIERLLENDPKFIYDFFYRKCRPLLSCIQWTVFNNSLKYDEIANSFYLYLYAPDADGVAWGKLRKFKYRSSLFTWLKVVAVRYFFHQKSSMPTIRSESDEKSIVFSYESSAGIRIDIQTFLSSMPCDRYRRVIESLILQDREPKEVAQEMGITVDNLYNIKRRALQQLTQLVRKEEIYG